MSIRKQHDKRNSNQLKWKQGEPDPFVPPAIPGHRNTNQLLSQACFQRNTR